MTTYERILEIQNSRSGDACELAPAAVMAYQIKEQDAQITALMGLRGQVLNDLELVTTALEQAKQISGEFRAALEKLNG